MHQDQGVKNAQHDPHHDPGSTKEDPLDCPVAHKLIFFLHKIENDAAQKREDRDKAGGDVRWEPCIAIGI